MYILSQNNDTLISTENLLNIYLCENGKTVKAQFVGGIFSKIATYKNPQFAEIALVKCFSAIENGEKCFRMPQNSDIEYQSGCNVHVKTKARLHGGS